MMKRNICPVCVVLHFAFKLATFKTTKFEQSEEVASPVSRAVHGFEGKGLLLNLEREHVLTVVLPVARGLPQFAVKDVGCHHLLETSLPVFTL